MKKKLLASLLSLTMVAGLAACGNGGNGSGDTSGSGQAEAVDTSEHVVITYMTTGGKPENSATDDMLAELNKILT